jgi:hypothetical protein
MTSKRISIVLGWAALCITLPGFTRAEPHLPSIGLEFQPLSEGITVIEDDRTTIWQFVVPSGERTLFRVKMAVVLSVRFELCEIEPEACGGAEGKGPGRCFDGMDDDGDGRADGLDPDCYGIQGWSLPVRAEYGWFENRSLTTRGTVADSELRPPGRRDIDGNFEKTEFAETHLNGGYWGLISAIVLTFFGGENRLLAGEYPILLFEGDLVVEPGPPRTERLASFRFYSELKGGSGQPVALVVNANSDGQPVETSRPIELEAVVIDGLAGEARFIRGDANTDGRVDIADAVATLEVLFRSGQVFRCLDAADADGDRAVGLTDAIHAVRHQFAGGPAPAPPYPGCGGGTPEGLGCEEASSRCR